MTCLSWLFLLGEGGGGGGGDIQLLPGPGPDTHVIGSDDSLTVDIYNYYSSSVSRDRSRSTTNNCKAMRERMVVRVHSRGGTNSI